MGKEKQSGWLNNIGRMVKKKDGGYFLVFERRKDKDGNYIGDDCFPLTINEGDFLQLRSKKDDLAGLVESGKLSQESADKICETVKFEINRAPVKEEAKTEKKKEELKKSKKDEVNF